MLWGVSKRIWIESPPFFSFAPIDFFPPKAPPSFPFRPLTLYPHFPIKTRPQNVGPPLPPGNGAGLGSSVAPADFVFSLSFSPTKFHGHSFCLFVRDAFGHIRPFASHSLLFFFFSTLPFSRNSLPSPSARGSQAPIVQWLISQALWPVTIFPRFGIASSMFSPLQLSLCSLSLAMDYSPTTPKRFIALFSYAPIFRILFLPFLPAFLAPLAPLMRTARPVVSDAERRRHNPQCRGALSAAIRLRMAWSWRRYRWMGGGMG